MIDKNKRRNSFCHVDITKYLKHDVSVFSNVRVLFQPLIILELQLVPKIVHPSGKFKIFLKTHGSERKSVPKNSELSRIFLD